MAQTLRQSGLRRRGAAQRGSTSSVLLVVTGIALASTAPALAAPPAGGANGVPGSGYVAALDEVRQMWPGEPPIASIEDAFRVRVTVGDRTLVADTHLFGGQVNVIPYHDEDGVTDAAGSERDRGDSVLSRYFPPGAIGFAVKHRRPAHRILAAGERSAAAMKEEIKFRDSHVELVVGVVRDGEPGVITLNSPQSYAGGRFGSASYPMIFVEPVYPDYLTPEQRRAFRDNIRTMMLGFDAVSEFPLRYSGGDPLAAHTPDRVRQPVAMMVRAIAGDAEARRWFAEEGHQIYCGELAHLSSSAGLLVPLNAFHLEPLVGPEVWTGFVRQVAAHRRGEASAFSVLNRNKFAPLVEASLAPDELAPAWTYAPGGDGRRLAFVPMTLADMVELFLRVHLPRTRLGESLAKEQGELLRLMRPGLLQLADVDHLPEHDPRRLAVGELFDRIVAVVGTPHAGYREFRAELEPLLAEARALSAPHPDAGEGLFAPPSLFHLVAKGLWPGGLLGLRYVGHGLHFSLVRAAD